MLTLDEVITAYLASAEYARLRSRRRRARARAGRRSPATWPHWGLLDAATITVPVGKDGEPRLLIVPDHVLNFLSARCNGPEREDLLFPGRTKDAPPDPKTSWPEIIRAAGVPHDCKLHWLRKNCATTLLRAGVDIASVQKVTGHETAAVLLRHDATAGEARQREVVTQHAGPCRRYRGCQAAQHEQHGEHIPEGVGGHRAPGERASRQGALRETPGLPPAPSPRCRRRGAQSGGQAAPRAAA